MNIVDFIWLPEIIEKLAVKHHVTQDETEETFFNRPKYRFAETGHQPGEDVYAALGQTDAGRYLVVFFIRKSNGRALILSARDMDQKERRSYERK
ncbi:MAG: BrnT family toxin [Acidobacteriota bacterium]|nr:BrnT family toxin [Acidobacteriota bacterium]